jgi:hypothetical protein
MGRNQIPKLYGSTTIHLSLQPPQSGKNKKILLLTKLVPVYTMNPTKGVTIKQHWQCTRCGVTITTYVTLSAPPQHRCAKAANQTKQLTPSEGDTNGK